MCEGPENPKRLPVIEVVEPEMAVILRSKTGVQRLQIANDMFVSARRMISNHLRAEHPEWDERRLQEAVARRLSHRTP